MCLYVCAVFTKSSTQTPAKVVHLHNLIEGVRLCRNARANSPIWAAAPVTAIHPRTAKCMYGHLHTPAHTATTPNTHPGAITPARFACLAPQSRTPAQQRRRRAISGTASFVGERIKINVMFTGTRTNRHTHIRIFCGACRPHTPADTSLPIWVERAPECFCGNMRCLI